MPLEFVIIDSIEHLLAEDLLDYLESVFVDVTRYELREKLRILFNEAGNFKVEKYHDSNRIFTAEIMYPRDTLIMTPSIV